MTHNEVLERIKEIQQRSIDNPRPDVVLFTRQVQAEIEALSVNEDAIGSPRSALPVNVYGIPFEVFDTDKEVRERRLELTAKGKRVKVITRGTNDGQR